MRLFYFLKKVFAYRYTVLIAPHHGASRTRSFSIGLPGIVSALTAWTLVTAAGLGFFVNGAALWGSWAESHIYKARVKVLAQEVARMREMARGMAFLESDLKYLMAKDNLGDEKNPVGPHWAHQISAPGKSKDTLADLMAGKITHSMLTRMQQERRAYTMEASRLLTEAGLSLVTRFDELNQRRSIPSDWPTIGALTSRFGTRFSPFDHEASLSNENHRGVDIANAEGTPIRAAASGIVRRAEWVNGYGRTVVLDHGFGYSTLYGHTSKIIISQGQFVERGDIIAYMGTTGRSTGSHLHFEVWEHGRPINPLRVVRINGLNADAEEKLAKSPESTIVLFPSGMGGGNP
ncbi:MAG: M23 family metallopeptidase [Elusimicrobia bacterium]|nr:M23 family metallopeptidase [Elusimicrobiota bacterium]